MEITREFLKANGVCEDGYKWWLKNCKGLPLLEQLEKIKNKNIEWFFWTIVRLMTKDQKNEFIIFAARKVLPIFEEEFPDDKAPRIAIEAAEKCFENPSKENKKSAAAASAAAYDASATYAADTAAASAAAVTFAAAFAAAADSSTYAAYYAAYHAHAAADAELKDEIVKYGIELLK